MRTLLFIAFSAAPIVFAQPASAASAAAEYVAQEHIARACEGAAGTIDADRLREIDLTGDGAKDLIVDHAGIRCSGERSQSMECGAAYCSVYLYVRKGKLLKLSDEFLAVGITVLGGKPPRLKTGATALRESAVLRWNGRKFAAAK